MSNQGNTAQGSTVEHLFAETILSAPQALAAILRVLGRDATAKPITARVVGGNKRKADVEIELDNDSPIRVSIKSFTGAGYNHLERRNLMEFCRRNQISGADTAFLKNIWLRKAKGSKHLVEEGEMGRVRAIFSSIEPALSSLLGSDHPQIFALYSINNGVWHLYDMNRQILPLVRQVGVSFTKQSSNIEIGRYIVIQRKGSRKGEYGKDPFHIDHGSNHVQIKMRVKRLWCEVEPVVQY